MTYLIHKMRASFIKAAVIATAVALIASMVLPAIAQAATMTLVSMTLGSSKPATATNMVVQITTATLLSGDTTASDDDAKILVRLPDASGGANFFPIGALVSGDIVLTGFPAGITVNSLTLSDRGTVNQNDTITIGLNMTSGTPAAIDIPAGTALTIGIVNNRITTPTKTAATGTADIFQISFATQANGGSTDVDNGATQVAVVDATTASATVNTTLTFTVAAIASGTSVFGVTTDAASTATTVPFATLAPNSAKEVAQRLTITTNAPTGYTTYVVQDQNLTAGANDIDQFKDGTRVDDASAATWTSPLVVASNEATYGHLGYGSTDTSVFASNATFAGVPTRAAASAAPVTTGLICDNTVQTSGDTCDVVYKVEITALQEAGSYTNEITYVIAPKY